jgi:hypothetical protein
MRGWERSRSRRWARSRTIAQNQIPPDPQFLDDLHSFQRVLFTNRRVRALADAIDAGASPLPDPDPRLSALE